jgi:hypothetical protein
VLVEAPVLLDGVDAVGAAPGHDGLETALAAYAADLAESPWQERAPLALAAVLPERGDDGRFTVRDAAGALAPLDVPRDDGLRLLALAAGRPLWLFGEWDGAALRPLAAQAGGRHVALAREAA